MNDAELPETPEEVLEVYRGDANAIRLQMPPRSWSGTAIMRLWDTLDRLLRSKQEAERMHVERKHIDATPDDGYPLRILSVYRSDCDMRWADTSDGDVGNPLTVALNEMQDKRASVLDRAIAALKEPKP